MSSLGQTHSGVAPRDKLVTRVPLTAPVHYVQCSALKAVQPRKKVQKYVVKGVSPRTFIAQVFIHSHKRTSANFPLE